MLYFNRVILESLRKIQDPRGTRTPNHWVMYSFPETDSIMPFISLRQTSLNFVPAGLLNTAGTTKTLSTDTFTASGSRSFRLQDVPTTIVLVSNNHEDPDIDWTAPDYFSYDAATNQVTIADSAPLNNGDTITISYFHDPNTQEMFGYRVEAAYQITCYAKKNTQGKDDENFEIDGEAYANGKLIDWLFENVYERILRDYIWFRKRQLFVKMMTASEVVFDPETRLFAKQIQIHVAADFLVENKELPITDVQGAYNLTYSLS